MTTWECRVVDSQGSRSLLLRSGERQDWILRDLHQEGFFVLGLKERGAGQDQQSRLKPKIILEFTQALATLMLNGLSLRETLDVATRIPGLPALTRLFAQIGASVQKGNSLRDSLSPWDRSFGSFYRGMVGIGERSGDLAPVLLRLAEYLIARQTLRAKTSNALMYPLFVVGVALVGLTLLATLVFPGLLDVVSSVNAGAAGAYAQTVSGFQTGVWWTISILAAIGLGVGWLAWNRRSNPVLDRWLGRVALQVPGLRDLLWAQFGLNFSFSMETLLQSGSTVEEALSESASVESNPYLRTLVTGVRDRVLQGASLSGALEAAGQFPPTLTAWVGVGEGAHDLKRSFGQLRNQYRQTVENFHGRYLALVEPALIVFVGAALLVLILTFVTPFFRMMGNLV